MWTRLVHRNFLSGKHLRLHLFMDTVYSNGLFSSSLWLRLVFPQMNLSMWRLEVFQLQSCPSYWHTPACGILASVGLEPLLGFHNAVGVICQTYWHVLVPSPLVLNWHDCCYSVGKWTGTELPNQLALASFLSVIFQAYRHWVAESTDSGLPTLQTQGLDCQHCKLIHPTLVCLIHWYWVAKSIGMELSYQTQWHVQAHWDWVFKLTHIFLPSLLALGWPAQWLCLFNTTNFGLPNQLTMACQAHWHWDVYCFFSLSVWNWSRLPVTAFHSSSSSY